MSEPAAAQPPVQITRTLMFCFALAGGASVANIYSAQPLLGIIANHFTVGISTAGYLMTATQVGYALGLLLICPLGDIANRKRLIPIVMCLAGAGLLLCGLAPNIWILLFGAFAVGLTTVSAQILLPLANELAKDSESGRVVGIVVSGLITGTLTGRIVSGVVADLAGWRASYFFFAALTLLLAALLARVIPVVPRVSDASYGQALRSVPALVRTERTLQVAILYGAAGMATFLIFWTSITFFLSGSPFHYSTAEIGLVGIAGLVGSVAAQGAGRLHDRGLTVGSNGAFWLLAVVSWVLMGVLGHSIVWLLVGIVLFDAASQGQRLLNSVEVLTISPEASSRTNTAYMTSIFVSGAIGSALASSVWSVGGWAAITLCGTALSLLALAVWCGLRIRAVLRPDAAASF